MISTKTVGLFEAIGPRARPPIVLLFCIIKPDEIIAEQFIIQDKHKGIFTAIDDEYNNLGIVKLDFSIFDYKHIDRYTVEGERFMIESKEYKA